MAFQRVQAATIFCVRQLWQQERPLLTVVSFHFFAHLLAMTCFVLLVMGLGLRFRDFFLLLGLPILDSMLLGVVFCLDFKPFFSLVPLPGVFLLFIYLTWSLVARITAPLNLLFRFLPYICRRTFLVSSSHSFCRS